MRMRDEEGACGDEAIPFGKILQVGVFSKREIMTAVGSVAPGANFLNLKILVLPERYTRK